MYSLSKLIYIINNLVAEWYFHSYFVFQIKIKIPLWHLRNNEEVNTLKELDEYDTFIINNGRGKIDCFLCKLF